QGMSRDDFDAERAHAAQALAVTGLPLVGMTLAGDGSWSARLWPKADGRYQPQWCANVRIAGQRLRLTYSDRVMPVPAVDERLVRTVSAWGERAQADLARLHVGVVGAGSVGSMVAEALARLGIVRISVMDFDSLEPHNLDRCLHAVEQDVGQAKAAVLRRGLLVSSTAESPDIHAYVLSVVEPDGFRVVLDCDVLF